MILITRLEAAQLIGITKNKLSEIIRHHKHLDFPRPDNTSLTHHQLFDKESVLKWAAKTDYKGIKWTQAPKPLVISSDRFDNAMAIKFNTASTKKHARPGGKTTVVHCIERNVEYCGRNMPMYKPAGNHTIYLDRSF